MTADQSEQHDVQELHAPIMREQAEPRDGFEPVPPYFAIFFGVIVFWAGYYLASYNGGFRADVYNERSVRLAGAGGPGTAVATDPVALGRRLFTANCAACHQRTGLGVEGQYPPLAGSEFVLGAPAIVKRIVLNGLHGPVTVKGATFNGNMPAFRNQLTDEQIALILSFVRQEWGNSAPAIVPPALAATREATAARKDPWTVAELERITQDEGPLPAPAGADSLRAPTALLP